MNDMAGVLGAAIELPATLAILTPRSPIRASVPRRWAGEPIEPYRSA
jgi:hypothetical protein